VAYKAFAAWAQTQRAVRIKRLRSDRGGEFTGNEFTSFLQQQGTERRLTTHDTLSTTALPSHLIAGSLNVSEPSSTTLACPRLSGTTQSPMLYG
jgi:hypothetical protein